MLLRLRSGSYAVSDDDDAVEDFRGHYGLLAVHEDDHGGQAMENFAGGGAGVSNFCGTNRI